MKKLIVIALAVVMALSVVAFAACAEPQTVEGEYSYENAWNPAQKYGVKVSVTVKGGRITDIKVEDDTDSFFNLSSGWEKKATWEQNGKAMIDSFVGLKVEDVLAIKVACDEETVFNDEAHYYTSVKGQPKEGGITGAPSSLKVVSGATQSSGRLILAVQNALANLDK